MGVNIEKANVVNMVLNPIAYVVHKVSTSLNYIHQEYRQRFGIESSYRLKNICRIRTTTLEAYSKIIIRWYLFYSS